MKTLKVLMCLAILFAALPARAQMFVGFDSFCGLPVVVGSDPQTASARTDIAGVKFIHVDPGAMGNWTASRVFVLAHECAHHLLGHTAPMGQAERFYGGTVKQELEADCWAATQLRRAGHLFDITNTVLDYASRGHFTSGAYPSGAARAQNIVMCSGGAPAASPRCRTVTVMEPYADVDVVMQPVQRQCQHCGCNQFGQCGCMHAFDVANQPVQVPVQRTRPVTRQICD